VDPCFEGLAIQTDPVGWRGTGKVEDFRADAERGLKVPPRAKMTPIRQSTPESGSSKTVKARIWHILGSQGQILALTSRKKSLKRSSLRSGT